MSPGNALVIDEYVWMWGYLTPLGFVFLGMFAIRAERDYVVEEDFMKAVRKVSDNKKLESKLDYKPV